MVFTFADPQPRIKYTHLVTLSLMGTRPQRTSPVLSASEIGQYTYCANAWYLQRCGHVPDSPALEHGTQVHHELGGTLDRVQSHEHRASRMVAAGLLILLLALLIFLLGVIL